MIDDIYDFLTRTQNPTDQSSFLKLVSKLKQELLLMGVPRTRSIARNVTTLTDPDASRKAAVSASIELRKELRPVDFKYLRFLLEKNQRRRVEGKDITILLGSTGAGKSTTVQFLGGVDFVSQGEVVVPADPQVRALVH